MQNHGKAYQIGYRDSEGHVHYLPLTHEDKVQYESLQSDIERKRFIQEKATLAKILNAVNSW